MSGARDHLPTEQPLQASAQLDTLETLAAVDLFQREDAQVATAVRAVRQELARAVDAVAARLARGGRLFYVGAGTSGRLGVLDASECPPTFQSAPEQVQALIAGGPAALLGPVEGAEDEVESAALELEQRGLSARDALLGISAGGTTPYVHAALDFARARGALTLFLACVPRELVPDRAELSLRVLTGPEILCGSTRLKAGTATKLVLNTLSTLVMVRLGKVHGNLMVDVDTSANAKLVERGISILVRLCGLERPAAAALLARAGGQVKLAALMQLAGLEAEGARARLEAAGGHLSRALCS